MIAIRIATVLVLIFVMLQGCDRDNRASDDSFEINRCDMPPDGWVNAESVSPDVVPPCNKGSTGTCKELGYVYEKGTGFCRPR